MSDESACCVVIFGRNVTDYTTKLGAWANTRRRELQSAHARTKYQLHVVDDSEKLVARPAVYRQPPLNSIDQ